MRKPKSKETVEHYTMHSVVPAYSCFDRIQKLAVDGFKSGKLDLYVDIRNLAEEGLGVLKQLENELKKELV